MAAHSKTLRGVSTITVGKLNIVEPAPGTAKLAIPGINKFSNFAFSEDKITAWKAYGIGEGLEFDVPPAYHISAAIDKDDSTTYPIFSVPTFQSMRKEPETCLPNPLPPVPGHDPDPEHEAPNQNCLQLFSCPVPNCVKTFNKHGNLERHIALGSSLHLYILVLLAFSNIFFEKSQFIHIFKTAFTI